MDTLTIECCLPGCCGADCIHRLPDTQRIEHKSWNPSILWSRRERFDVLYIVPHCAKAAERAEWRSEIFAQADVAVEVVSRAQYKTSRGWVKACHDVFEPFARLWWDGPCKFYSSVPSDPGALATLA